MPAKPIIVIRYYGGDEPKVELPESLQAEIQFIDQDNQDNPPRPFPWICVANSR